MKLYTCLEAAAAFGVDQTRVRVLCRSGRLGRKHGRPWPAMMPLAASISTGLQKPNS